MELGSLPKAAQALSYLQSGLSRIPCDICIRPLDKPIYRQIGIAMRSENVSAAMQKFLTYVTVPEMK